MLEMTIQILDHWDALTIQTIHDPFEMLWGSWMVHWSMSLDALCPCRPRPLCPARPRPSRKWSRRWRIKSFSWRLKASTSWGHSRCCPHKINGIWDINGKINGKIDILLFVIEQSIWDMDGYGKINGKMNHKPDSECSWNMELNGIRIEMEYIPLFWIFEYVWTEFHVWLPEISWGRRKLVIHSKQAHTWQNFDSQWVDDSFEHLMPLITILSRDLASETQKKKTKNQTQSHKEFRSAL